MAPDGSQLTAITTEHTVDVYRCDDGRLQKSFAVPGASAVAYSPDGKLIACASNDVTLIDTQRLTVARTVTGHAQPLTIVVFSPDSKLVAFSGHDHTITFRDARTGDYLAGLPSPAHGNPRDLAFSPDGRKLLLAAVVLPDMQLSMIDLDYPRRLDAQRGALEHARQVLHKNENEPGSLIAFGRWCGECGDWDDAARYLEKARQHGGEVPPALFARFYWKLGSAAKAKAEFTKALQIARGQNEQAKGDQLEMCIQALDAGPPLPDRRDVDFHYATGYSFETKSDWDEAIHHYDLVIEAQPERADVARDRKAGVQSRQANSLAQAGWNLDDALLLAQSALQRDARNAEYLAILGWVYNKRGEFAQAAGLLTQAAKDERPVLGTRATIFDRLGDALWRTGASGDAVTAWKQAKAYAEQLALQVHVARIDAMATAAAGGNTPEVAPVPSDRRESIWSLNGLLVLLARFGA